MQGWFAVRPKGSGWGGENGRCFASSGKRAACDDPGAQSFDPNAIAVHPRAPPGEASVPDEPRSKVPEDIAELVKTLLDGKKPELHLNEEVEVNELADKVSELEALCKTADEHAKALEAAHQKTLAPLQSARKALDVAESNADKPIDPTKRTFDRQREHLRTMVTDASQTLKRALAKHDKALALLKEAQSEHTELADKLKTAQAQKEAAKARRDAALTGVAKGRKGSAEAPRTTKRQRGGS
jgi:chromosome segregation ATPase